MGKVINKCWLFAELYGNNLLDRQIKEIEDRKKSDSFYQECFFKSLAHTSFKKNYGKPVIESREGKESLVFFEIENPPFSLCLRDKYQVNKSPVKCTYIKTSSPYINFMEGYSK